MQHHQVPVQQAERALDGDEALAGRLVGAVPEPTPGFRGLGFRVECLGLGLGFRV